MVGARGTFVTLRYEGVRFGDGSVAVRRLADDPCDRATLTFESVRELEEDVGSAEVTWIADRTPEKANAEALRVFFGRPGMCERWCRHSLGAEKCSVCPQAPTAEPAPPAEPLITIKTEEDWRKHFTGRPPAWFLNLPAEQPITVILLHEHAEAAAQDSDSESIRPDIGSGPNPQSAVAPCVEKQGPASAELSAIRRHDEFAIPMRPAYEGDGHPAIRASGYAPEPEDVESI